LSLRLLRKERKMSKKKPRFRGHCKIFPLQLLILFILMPLLKNDRHGAGCKFNADAPCTIEVFFAKLSLKYL